MEHAGCDGAWIDVDSGATFARGDWITPQAMLSALREGRAALERRKSA
ncbi:MAG: hypothetical protein MSC30_09345 [Gaiellaceae bacterium MAG52_C11]|nr:hypothetical protein [Candidatus Gaiellasilicea maunaloa]